MERNSCRRCGSTSTRVRYTDDGFCLSIAACTKRLRARVGVTLELERAALVDAETQWALDNIAESARIATEIRNVYYRHGLCADCGVRPHSAGRPRCEACHRQIGNAAPPV